MLEDIKHLMIVRQQPEKLATLSEPAKSHTTARLQAARLCHHSVSIRFADALAHQEPRSLLTEARLHLRSGYYYVEGYDRRNPTRIPSAIKDQLAPEAKYCEKSRCNTKYRVISSLVPAYINPDKIWITSDDPMAYPTIRIATTCGINLMGSSYQELDRYLPNSTLNRELYQQDLENIIDNLFMHAIEKNIKSIRTVPFGVGAYLKTVTNAKDKEFARAQTLELLARYARRHSITVIWTIWEKDKEAEQAKLFYGDILKKNKLEHPYINIVVSDILRDAITYSQEHQTRRQDNAEFVLNAGSDRTIGGKWTAEDPHTIEEQLAQLTGLLDVQTVTHNPEIEAKLQLALCYLSDRTVRSRMTTPDTAGFFAHPPETPEDAAREVTRKIAVAIQIKHALSETPTVAKERHSNVLRISFQHPSTATMFFTTLKTMGFFNTDPDNPTADTTTIQLKDPDETRRYFDLLHFM